MQQDTDRLRERAEQLRRKKDYRHALLLFETLLQRELADGSAWLGAAECALDLGLGDRALELLAELKPFYDASQVERWVNLRSEALRRFGDPGEGLAFVDVWEGRVGSQTRVRLLLRKAALLIRRGCKEAAMQPIQQALDLAPEGDSSLMVSLSNVALLAGQPHVAALAGKRLLHSRHAPAGAYLWLFGSLFGAHPLLVRLPTAAGLAAVLLVPGLRPLAVVILAILALGVLVSWTSGMIVLRSSLTVLALGIGVAYALFLLAGKESVGAALGTLLLCAMALALGVLWWRARKRAQEKQREA